MCPEYDRVKHKHLKFYFSMGHGGNNVTRVVFIKYMMKKPNKMLYLSPKKYLRCGEWIPTRARSVENIESARNTWSNEVKSDNEHDT